MLQEFKKFIMKGNIVDMAIGVIVGGAFGKIVTSLVEDILMPIIGMIIGGINFTDLQVTVGGAAIRYGNFIQNIINFLIIALTIFFMMKIAVQASKTLHMEKKKEEAAPAGPTQEELLTEIRDLLREK
ncbi:MAG: large-conductance mechanosensitive channel protein MscL [Lachnospiraceae bacterium]